MTWAVSDGPDAASVPILCFLDNQGYPERIAPGVECLLAVGVRDSWEAPAGEAFSTLKAWARDQREWLFGHFAYDLASETEPGSARSLPKPDPIGFPDLFFFIPQILIELSPAFIRIGCFEDDGEAIWRQIVDIPVGAFPGAGRGGASGGEGGRIPPFKARFTPAEYQDRVARLQRHMLRGDCYEVNFCQEFYSQPANLDVLAAWWSLSQASPNPFSCFYRVNGSYLLCASPERYLKKTGNRLFSQPIKGTSARYPDLPAADSASARDLFHSAKDRSENVMVVDLVRNDLSKICLPGSVGVEELYGIYPFPQVFQMISTITGTFSPDLHWTDAIRETFPMGSMTGAPKHRVVALIEQYERSRRGIFSGAVGYVSPWGDFDFNVVIRSILYNSDRRYLSYQVGSGITFYSRPEAEYEECRIKALGILKALGAS
ncbi:MAG TPA: anthranilate synthase component I family protein [Puia sp.]|nr:anthranilate synthase component I family protein [Puia sp.]